MANLEVLMRNCSNTTTQAVGEIFADPRGPSPIVSDVNVRIVRSSHCHLGPGDYTYMFHVDGDSGTFDLEITGTGNPANPTKHADTALGFSGWTFNFHVV